MELQEVLEGFEPSGLKRCNRCREDKPLDEFTFHSETLDGRQVTCKVCCNKANLERHIKDPRHRLLYSARFRAKKQNLPFDITLDDIEVPEFCPVLGIEIIPCSGHNGPHCPSLDKIIPALGYIRGNVVVVSNRANTLKRDATPEEMRMLADFYGDY